MFFINHKKSVTEEKITRILFTFLFIPLFFSGCKNFLQGSDFLTQLDNSIEYLNAPYTNIVVAADMDEVKEIQPSNGTYDKEYKVTDTINLTVTERSAYQFIKWSVEPVDAVKFINGTNDESKTISLKILRQSDTIKIVPVCAIKPKVSFNPGPSETGVKKNRSIVVTFSKEMVLTQGSRTNDASEDENFTNDITIQSGDSDYSVYFESGKLSDDKLSVIFYPKKDTLIPAFTESKIINITVPGKFYYNYDSDGQKVQIPIGETVTNSYSIVNETEDYITIIPQVQTGTGDLSFAASKTYYLGEEVTYTFTPSEDYEITGWSLKYKENEEEKDIDDGYIVTKTSEDNKTITLIMKAGIKQDVILRPECHKKGTLGISISAKYAKYTPVEQKSCHKDEVLTITCNEDKDYCFIRWTVYDTNNNELKDYADIIEFLNGSITQSQASIKVNSVDTAIVLKPVLVVRPAGAGYSPNVSGKGVQRGSTIQVMFTQPMDESSIYYSNDDEEIKDLDNSKYTLLKIDDVNSSNYGKIYGYYETAHPENVIYKNICINAFAGNHENLLQYYGIPFFDPNNAQILKIPVKGKTQNQMPPENLDIYVSIKKDFCYKDSNTKQFISLTADYNFTYRTNEEFDADPPQISKYSQKQDTEEDVVLRVVPEGEKSYSSTWKKTIGGLDTFATDKVKAINAKSQKLWLRSNVQDEGTGITKIEYVISSEKAEIIEGTQNKTIYPKADFKDSSKDILTYPVATKEVISVSECIDLSELNLPEGYYKFTLNVYDACENIASKTFHFVYDTVSHEITSPCTKVQDGRIYLCCESTDDKTKITVWSGENNLGDMTAENELDISEVGLENGKECSLCIKAEDYAGNISEGVSYGGIFYGKFGAEAERGALLGFSAVKYTYINKTYCYKQGDTIIPYDEKYRYYYEISTQGGSGPAINYYNGVIKDSDRKIGSSSSGFRFSEKVVIPTGCIAQINGNTETGDVFSNGRKVQLRPFAMSSLELATNNTVYSTIHMDWLEAVKTCNIISNCLGLDKVYYLDTNGERDYNESKFTKELLQDIKSDITRNGYRLPTEAEWEFAARGGDPSAEDWNYEYSGVSDKSKLPNSYNRINIAKMSYTEWEWCNDYYVETLSPDFNGGYLLNPEETTYSENHVIRGGFNINNLDAKLYERSSRKYDYIGNYDSNTISPNSVALRLCRNLPE